jgi:hypothetical protein
MCVRLRKRFNCDQNDVPSMIKIAPATLAAFIQTFVSVLVEYLFERQVVDKKM